MHYVQLIIVLALMMVASAAVMVAVIRPVASHKDVPPTVEEYVPELGNILIVWSPDDLRLGRVLYQEGWRFVYLHGGGEDYMIAESGQFFALRHRVAAEVVARSYCYNCNQPVTDCVGRCYNHAWNDPTR